MFVSCVSNARNATVVWDGLDGLDCYLAAIDPKRHGACARFVGLTITPEEIEEKVTFVGGADEIRRFLAEEQPTASTIILADLRTVVGTFPKHVHAITPKCSKVEQVILMVNEDDGGAVIIYAGPLMTDTRSFLDNLVYDYEGTD